MNQDSIESTLSQALNSYQHPQIHLPGGGVATGPGLPTATPAPSSSAGTSSKNKVNSAADASVSPETARARVNKNSGQKFGAKKRSWVWNWFVQDLEDSNIAVCDQCGKIIRRLPSDKGSPKKLSEHLRTHKIDKATGNPGRDHMVGIHPSQNTAASSGLQHNSSMPLKSVPPGGLGHIPQHLLAEFDISQYSQIKFHKDIMKFLTDNKLPISVVKSPSFRQMVFTLRPESIEDLNELNNIYASLMEVLKNNDNPAPSPPNSAAAAVSGPTASSTASAEPPKSWI